MLAETTADLSPVSGPSLEPMTCLMSHVSSHVSSHVAAAAALVFGAIAQRRAVRHHPTSSARFSELKRKDLVSLVL